MNAVELGDRARALLAPDGEDDSDEYCQAEQDLAIAADHEDACSYTLKATSLEIIDHLEAVARGDQKELCGSGYWDCEECG